MRFKLFFVLILVTYSQFSSEWDLGFASSYTIKQNKEILVELHDRVGVGSSNGELLYNIGTRYLVANNLSFIGSVGKIVEGFTEEDLSWNLYLGLQFRI